MINNLFTRRYVIWISIFLAAFLLNFSYFIFTDFADTVNTYVSSIFRFVFAKITNIIPFSLAEILIYCSIPLVSLIVFLSMRKSKTIKEKILFSINSILKITTVIYLIFVITFAPGYNAKDLDNKLGFERTPVSANELYDTLIYVIEKTNEYAANIDYNELGSSAMPFTLDELSDKHCDSYKKVFDQYDMTGTFSSRVKPLIISPFMTYTHISGVYSFFTGEANLNTNYPDFVNVFSAAHELAHQRGIAREDEANFMAYLICISSDDDYIKYSGYLNMYQYISNALYTADKELHKKAIMNLSDEARNELIAYSKFFDKYRNDTISVVSDTVNDVYLKSQGTKGSVSYGMVVDLAVSYHKNCK